MNFRIYCPNEKLVLPSILVKPETIQISALPWIHIHVLYYHSRKEAAAAQCRKLDEQKVEVSLENTDTAPLGCNMLKCDYI